MAVHEVVTRSDGIVCPRPRSHTDHLHPLPSRSPSRTTRASPAWSLPGIGQRPIGGLRGAKFAGWLALARAHLLPTIAAQTAK